MMPFLAIPDVNNTCNSAFEKSADMLASVGAGRDIMIAGTLVFLPVSASMRMTCTYCNYPQLCIRFVVT